MGPEQPNSGETLEGVDVSSPHRPPKQIWFQSVRWIEEDVIGAGLEAELAQESFAYRRMSGLHSGKHVTQPIPDQNPGPAAGERRLRKTPTFRDLKSCSDSVICRR